MKSKIFFIGVSVFLICFIAQSCTSEPKTVIYKKNKYDDLSFLVSNSDLISEIEIIDGVDDDYSFSMFNPPPEEAKAIITKVYYRSSNKLNDGDDINISSSPLYEKKDVLTIIYLKESKYLAFLVKEGSIYRPVTEFSLLEIRNNNVEPIWKMEDNKELKIPNFHKDIIISEIERAIAEHRSGKP